jgi:hypothetical protein
MASESDEREARVVRGLRQATACAAAFGVLAICLGYLEVTITDLEYRRHVERAGSDEVHHLAAAARGVDVARPRWPQLVAWIVWLTTWLVLGALLAIHEEPYEMIDPLWLRPLITASIAMMALVVVVVLPLIRRTHGSQHPRRDPPLPPARTVRQ